MDSCLRLWDYVSGTVKKTYSGHKNEGFSIGGCFGSVDGEAFIAAPSEDGEIVLWDVKSKDVVQRIQAHTGVCFWVDVWQDIMVSAGMDGKIRIYKHRGPEVVEEERIEKTNGVAVVHGVTPIEDDMGALALREGLKSTEGETPVVKKEDEDIKMEE